MRTLKALTYAQSDQYLLTPKTSSLLWSEYFSTYAVYISQLIRFARVCSHVEDFNTRCHRLNCDYSLGGVMGSVLMCILVLISISNKIFYIICF